MAAIDFRQPPEAGYPASVCDINLAIRWLKAHAAEFNGTTTVGAFGNSSGGHLVVLSALRPRHPSYSALPLPGRPEVNASLAYVIAGWPVIDPLYRFRYAKEINNQEHVKAHIEYWRTEEAMAEGSPQTIIERDEQVELPPILMLLKANDRNHPLEMQGASSRPIANEAGPSRCTRSMACRTTMVPSPASRKRCAPSRPSPHSFGAKLVKEQSARSDTAILRIFS